ncbi:MAG: endolytic transglycosylase MltG [Candidatus Cardinium sp.]|nr:endolytic transglycosylase MltG [Candidatus Cardinium sp.]
MRNIFQWIAWGGSIVGMFLYSVCHKPNVCLDRSERLLLVERGVTLEQLALQLKQEGYIQRETTFLWTAYLLRYNPQKSAGHYRLTHCMSNWEAIKKLRASMQHPVKVAFATADGIPSLVEQLVKRTGLSKKRLLDLLHNPQYVARYGFSTENVLTMFIPATYEVYWTITEEQLLSKIHAHYTYFWNKQRLHKAANMSLTPIAVSILASIVQSETNDLQEASIITGVYLNRIRRKMPIQACPTVAYALKKQLPTVQRILEKDIEIDSPYNSYRSIGLPPGPITLPSVAMIDAVLNYVQHDYLFFSAREDFSGLHYFTTSFAAHVKNANKYRKALDALKIMR